MNLIFNVEGAGTDLLNDVSAADSTKWTARYQGTRYVGAILTNVAPDTLYLQMTPTAPRRGRATFRMRSDGSWRHLKGSRCNGKGLGSGD
jgi:hypothetical protein